MLVEMLGVSVVVVVGVVGLGVFLQGLFLLLTDED
jgi:hypothetical protein